MVCPETLDGPVEHGAPQLGLFLLVTQWRTQLRPHAKRFVVR
jgi:hypothetical protein